MKSKSYTMRKKGGVGGLKARMRACVCVRWIVRDFWSDAGKVLGGKAGKKKGGLIDY